MLIVSITGGIGTGKSYVANIFYQLNVPIINADNIAKQLLIKDKFIINQIKSHFNVFKLNKETFKKLKIDISQNKKNRLFLEKLIHPKVVHCINEQIKSLNNHPPSNKVNMETYCIIEIPLVFDFLNIIKQININKLVLTNCEPSLQISRVMHRDLLTKRQALSIINAQLAIGKIKDKVDYFIDTNIMSNLKQQIISLHRKFIHLDF